MLYLLVATSWEAFADRRAGSVLCHRCIAAALFIVISTWLQYDNTFLDTYVESGVRPCALAEKVRKIPLSFFGRRISPT